MAARWRDVHASPHSGLHAARGVVLALLPAIAFWIVLGLLVWVLA